MLFLNAVLCSVFQSFLFLSLISVVDAVMQQFELDLNCNSTNSVQEKMRSTMFDASVICFNRIDPYCLCFRPIRPEENCV